MAVTTKVIAHPGNVYEGTFPIEENVTKTRHFAPNKTKPEDRSGLHNVEQIFGKTKGAGDAFALIGRSAKFVTPYLPTDIADWTDHVSGVVLKARSALSLVNLPRVWRAFREKITFRSTFDLLATSCHALALFIRDVVSKTISSIGSMFKALVDCNDLVDTTKKFFDTRQLCNLAAKGEGVSEEVKSGLNSEWYEQLFKIIKYSLAAIAGLITAFVFCTGMALPAAVGVAVLAGTIVSAIFSVAAEYTRENADYVDIKV